jgi:16S rRNA (guanine966-N2)-methyltransferase
MRVVAGELGGRRIVGPDGTSTRPTTDRVREAMFNALGSAGLIRDALVADLFAGSGAIGIEALSRGAEHCIFVERDRRALRALDDNVVDLGLTERATILRSDVLQIAATIDADIAFADPPYEFDGWPQLLDVVQADVVVVESGAPLDAPEGWTITRAKRYGRTWLTFLENVRAGPGPERTFSN